jgi:hypothetical protein
MVCLRNICVNTLHKGDGSLPIIIIIIIIIIIVQILAAEDDQKLSRNMQRAF